MSEPSNIVGLYFMGLSLDQSDYNHEASECFSKILTIVE